MIQCATCGQQHAEPLSFCTRCGAPIRAQDAAADVRPGDGSPGAAQAGGTHPTGGPSYADQPYGDPPQPYAVGAAATPAAGSQPVPPSGHHYPPGGQQPTTDAGGPRETPAFWTAPARSPRRSGPLLAVSALIILALGIGGFAIWKVFFGAENGADTPQEAVTELLEAAADQDGVAGLRMLNPDEVRGADEVWDALQERLEDAEMLDDGEVSGTSFEVDDLETEVQELSDHAAKVVVTGGTITAEVSFTDLPEQLADVAGVEGEGGDHSLTLDFADFRAEMGAAEDFFMIVVEKDGRWFVSPVATVAEWVAVSQGMAGDWELYEEGRDRDPVTGESPEEALEVLADSFRLDDLNAVLDALPAGQGDLLRPYTRLLEDDARSDGAPDIRFEFHGDELTVGEPEDDLVRVDLERVQLDRYDAAQPDLRAEVGLDGACGYARDPAMLDAVTECLPDGVLEATGEDNVFVMVREVAGGWQLDPMATLIAWADVAVANVSSRDLGQLVDLM